MSRLLLRLDGQNLCQTVLDTGELSVLRGGGLALLYAPEKLFARLRALGHVLEEVYCGSSEGLAYLSVPEGRAIEDYERELHGEVRDFLNGVAGPKDDELTQDLLPILPFLTVSFNTLPESGDFSADHRALLNRNRTRQFQTLTVDLLPPEETWKTGLTPDGDSYEKPCLVDRTRPISKEIDKGGKKLPVSASVYFRQRQGRQLRQRFYREELSREKDLPAWREHHEDIRQAILRGDGAYRFSDHFGEIAMPPERKDMKVPLKLQGKMAVIYADGNRFGEIKRELCKQPNDYRDFSLHVQRKRRQLLSRVIEVVCDALIKDPEDPKGWVIPMETLLWGGDEFCLVVPAWSALKVLETIAPLLGEGWAWRGRELTHAWGLVFCHHKTPIREVRSLAEGLAESVKDLRDEQGRQVGRAGNYLQYMVLMGMDPPVGGVECFREAHYCCTTATPFTFDLQHLSQTMATLKEFLGLAVGSTGKVSGGVPPSQLYKLREWAMRDRLLDQAEDQPGFQAWLEKATERLKAYRDSRGEPFSWQHLKASHMAYDRRYPLIPLFHILHLGDYVEPFQSRGGAA